MQAGTGSCVWSRPRVRDPRQLFFFTGMLDKTSTIGFFLGALPPIHCVGFSLERPVKSEMKWHPGPASNRLTHLGSTQSLSQWLP